MKKLLSYLLVIALVLVQFMPLVKAIDMDGVNSGSTQAGNKGSITVSNALSGKKYSIYQILELESFDDEKNAYTYNAASEEWNKFLNSAAIKGVYLSYDSVQGVWTWLKTTDADAQAFAQKALAYAIDNGIEATASKTAAADGEISFKEIPLGYYIIDSTAGALVSLTTTHAEAKVVEKNKLPDVKKEVEEDSTKQYGENNTADYFQVVNFKTTIDVEAGAENYVLVDVMSKGLTLDTKSFKLTHANGKEIPSSKYDLYTTKNIEADNLVVDYNGETTTATFIIKFKNDYMASLVDDESTAIDDRDIIVYYSATVNLDAVVESTGNTNETWLEYGDDNETSKDITRTYTLSFDVIKTNANNEKLDGAEFELYDEAGNKINLFKNEDGTYRIAAEGETVSVIKAGTVEIKGLDADTYFLEETKAPEGYNKLSSRIIVEVGTDMADDKITINATVNGNFEEQIVTYSGDDVRIKNFTGSLLPSTGGMGTVLFITVGSIMVLGFGVLLVTKLRLSKMEI